MNAEPRIPMPSPETAPWFGLPLDHEVVRFANAAMRLRRLDAVVTEVVRLKCAGFHDCRQCQSLRLGEAVEAGVDDAMTSKVDRFETSDLDERLKVALRFTEAMIIFPDFLTAELVATVREHFSPEEVVELALDIMKWSQQKPQVSLRVEAPRSDGLTLMDFDEDGGFVRGGSVQGSRPVGA